MMKTIDKEDRVVICAGYVPEMTSFLRGNDGFRRLIYSSGGGIFTFDSYTVDKLVEVFNRTLMKLKCAVDDDDVTPEWVKSQIEDVDEDYRNKSNAGLVVTWIERAMQDGDPAAVLTCEETGDELKFLSLRLLKKSLQDTIME